MLGGGVVQLRLSSWYLVFIVGVLCHGTLVCRVAEKVVHLLVVPYFAVPGNRSGRVAHSPIAFVLPQDLAIADNLVLDLLLGRRRWLRKHHHCGWSDWNLSFGV